MKLDEFFQIFFITRRVSKEITDAFDKAGYDYLLEHYIILFLLKEKKLMKQNDNDLDVIRNKATVTRAVEKLVKQGLITRTADQEDRRINILEITEKGVKIFNEIKKIYEDTKNELKKGISEKDLEEFFKIFHKIMHDVQLN